MVRHSLWESLGFWGEEFQWDLQAVAQIDGQWHGSSYREDDVYLIPEAALKDGNGLQAQCRGQNNRLPLAAWMVPASP